MNLKAIGRSLDRVFQQVDVFTATPYLGNPVAVVMDGAGLSTEQMQAFTNWTNLSECTFILPATNAQADYKLRIFCPGRELPFAGHPTLGSAHAWANAGGKPKGEFIVQECAIGLVKIKRDGAKLAFSAPPLLNGKPLNEERVDLIARGLGLKRDEIIAHSWCDNGPKWQAVMLADPKRVLALKADQELLKDQFIGIVAPQPAGNDTQFEVRAFFPGNTGVIEDPVTGSLNAAIAQWLIGSGQAPSRYTAAQGTAMGRAGRVHIEQIGAELWVGGESVTCIEGKVFL